MPTVEVFPAGEMNFANASSEGIIGEPIFYGSGQGTTTIMLITVKDSKGDVVRRYNMRISGNELRLSLQERSNPVSAAFEREDAKKDLKDVLGKTKTGDSSA